MLMLLIAKEAQRLKHIDCQIAWIAAHPVSELVATSTMHAVLKLTNMILRQPFQKEYNK